MEERMAQGDPTYKMRLEQVLAFLETKHAIVLATAEGDRVTARTVTFVSRGVEIYFLSLAENTKCRQIEANPNVALCRDHVQIEGTAELLGPAGSDECSKVAELFRAKYADAYERHINHSAMVAIRMRPTRIRFFYMEQDRFLVDQLDIASRTLTVERLDEATNRE